MINRAVNEKTRGQQAKHSNVADQEMLYPSFRHLILTTQQSLMRYYLLLRVVKQSLFLDDTNTFQKTF